MNNTKLSYKEVEISSYIRSKIEEFANSRSEKVDLYKRRGGYKRIDVVTGALAEYAVYTYLRSKGIRVKKPDFNIYEVNQKSYDPDLTDGNLHFHVKGQNKGSASMYGQSWIMQRSDKLTKAPIKNHYLVPCSVDTDTNKVKIYGIMSFSAVHHYSCFGECKNTYFQRTKVAIYLENLKNLSYNARWGLIKRVEKKCRL